MGATRSEQANTLWLRLKLLLDIDGEVIHSDQMDFDLIFSGSVVHFVARRW